MMDTRQNCGAILQELGRVLDQVDPAQASALAEAVLEAGRVFLAGAGRSGMAARGFAMRLTHLGRTAFVCGETTTPGIGAGDLLVVVSGSGETASLIAMAQKAAAQGARVALVTVRPESTVGRMAGTVLQVPAPTPKADSGFRSVQPMGSLFEQASFLLLDALVMELMERLGEGEDAMFSRHANLE